MKEKLPTKTSEKIRFLLSVLVFLAFVPLTIWGIPKVMALSDPVARENLQQYFASKGIGGWLIFLVVQILQVVVAMIPGEPIEICAGLLYGPVWGTLSCMLGIYLINDITMDIAQMIDYANTARKSIKDSHESCIAFYNGKLEEKFIREHRLSSIMRQSLKNHEFIVFYQPKVNIYTNQCVGVEALVRWRRQDGNMIYPSEFIPLFEKNHFIIDLDMYVLEQVCIQINTWIKQGKKPLPVSVNISRVDLKNNDIVKQIVEICDTYQINRSLIELEITESAFLENESIAIERSKELKAEGFLLSIDDFGTGFSSLSLLKDLPMDVLKLDHTFFQTQMNKREKIILTNIIRMAKQLDMTIVSEGIETRQHVAFLKTIGCEIAQGFYYARPNEINQLDLWGNFEGEDVS